MITGDKKVFEKALKIIVSKSKTPKEEFMSSSMIRYNDATEKWDIIGCAEVINELKIYFVKSSKNNPVSYQMMFVKALRVLGELYSYHNGDKKNKNWENTVKILKSIDISEDHERFKELKSFFSKKN